MLRQPVLLKSDKGTTAKHVEREFDLGDCLYFYAGYACHRYGRIALVYEPDMTQGKPGYATPFDSGWLYCGDEPKRKWDSVEDRRSYLHSVRFSLGEWHGKFDDYISEYFSSEKSYISGEPPQGEHPSGMYKHPKSERVGWTWEIQLHDDHNIFEKLKLMVVPHEIGELLRIGLSDLDEIEAVPWDDLFDSGRFRQVHSSDGEESSQVVCLVAEREMASWV